jgi:3-dehydroquinate synthase
LQEILQQNIQVNYSYAIHFTQQVFADDNPLLRNIIYAQGLKAPGRVLCLIDHAVSHPRLLNDISTYCHYYQNSLDLVCPPLVLEGGEQVKNSWKNVMVVQEAIHRHHLCRHSYVLAIGGGAILDMVGYAAATAHRGIPLIRIPTTVLAQCDSGVGVKNSMNAFGKKNFVGTFAPPYAVINDTSFLTMLSTRDWRSGISEAIKVALLKDPTFFTFLEQQAQRLMHRDMMAMRWLIYRCAQLHLEHIAQGGDPFEFGSSRPLDFGHWAAHKLEQLSGYTLRHGEAVAIGIALDCTYAYFSNVLNVNDWQRILALLSTLGFTIYTDELCTYLQQSDHSRCLLTGLEEFREHLGGELTIPLLHAIGQSVEVHSIDKAILQKSIVYLARYQKLQPLEV